jgi:hypothetical protein
MRSCAMYRAMNALQKPIQRGTSRSYARGIGAVIGINILDRGHKSAYLCSKVVRVG